jgi:Sulfocyanin (SoxE) domain
MRSSCVTVTCVLAAVVAVTGGCSSHPNSAAVRTGTAGSPREPGRPDPRRFLAVNTAAKTVRLTMLAALGSSNNGFNFDGYGRGELVATVPQGWRVTVQFENRGPRRTSCAVVAGARARTLAFPGASVPDPLRGLPPGGKAQFAFDAARKGSFRIESLVPGESEARMFAVLVVTRGGTPSMTARPGP